MSAFENSTSHSAETYDLQITKTIPFYDEFHYQTINIVGILKPTPKLWLDTGCGTGTLVERAIVSFPATKFILADPSPQMLKVAKSKLDTMGKVEFLEPVTTKNLQWSKDPFDVITSIQSHHYQSPEARVDSTAACYRMLTKTGIYVTFENIRPQTPDGIEIGKKYWTQFQLSKGRDFNTVEAHMKRFGIEYQPITVDEHLALLRKTGFSVVSLLWYSYMQAGFYCVK